MNLLRMTTTILLASFLLAISAQAATIPFPNGSFETFPVGGLNDWTWPSSSHWTWDNTTAHSGNYSARVYRNSGGETASLYSAYAPVQPSTVYTLTYWLKTQNATASPSVNLYQYSDNLDRTGLRLSAYANIGDGNNDWQLKTYRFQTMPNTRFIRVRLFLWTTAAGAFNFDDFSLEGGIAATYPFQSGFPVNTSGGAYFASPTVADIDNDGDNELLMSGGSRVDGWDSAGQTLPNFPLATNDKRINGQLALADLTGDGKLEIVAGTQTAVSGGQARVFVWRHNGSLLSNWPQKVDWNTQYSNNDSRVTSVVLADVNNDNRPEILASTTNNASSNPGSEIIVPNLYAWGVDGALLSGDWPNWRSTAGSYAPIAVADLHGNGDVNILVARDYHYLNVYQSNGDSLSGWPVETFVNGASGDYQTDLRVEYGSSAPVAADLDGDGSKEYIIVGNVKGPGNQSTISNSALLVVQSNGTRYPGWESAALGSGILSDNFLPRQAPAIADLDSDGQLEIIAATYDGWLRVYRADKTLLWAFNYTQGALLFASEAIVGDVDGDGALEILFGTYIPFQGEGDKDGPVALWGLEADGNVMDGFPLPISTPGLRVAPTLADLDGDGDLEILAAMLKDELFVWDTPTPAFVSLPWAMGRHDLQRSAAYQRVSANFDLSRKFATPSTADYGERATFTIRLNVISDEPLTHTIRLSDTIPLELSIIPGSVSAPPGTITQTGNLLQWQGVLTSQQIADITYDVLVATTAPKFVANTVVIDTGPGGIMTRQGIILVNGLFSYLPLIFRH